MSYNPVELVQLLVHKDHRTSVPQWHSGDAERLQYITSSFTDLYRPLRPSASWADWFAERLRCWNNNLYCWKISMENPRGLLDVHGMRVALTHWSEGHCGLEVSVSGLSAAPQWKNKRHLGCKCIWFCNKCFIKTLLKAREKKAHEKKASWICCCVHLLWFPPNSPSVICVWCFYSRVCHKRTTQD